MSSNIIESKRKKLVGHWLYNLINGISNKEILIIISLVPSKILIENFKDFFNSKFINDKNTNPEYTITNINEFINDKSLTKKNTILIGNKVADIDIFKNFENKALCYTKKSDFKNIKEDFFKPYLEIDEYINKPDITENEKSIFYLLESDAAKLISKSSHLLEDFIFNTYGEKSFCNQTSLRYLLKDTNLDQEEVKLLSEGTTKIIKKDGTTYKTSYSTFETSTSLQNEYLSRDLVIFKEKGLLTSRLSILIYRKAFFDMNANITQIGRYFSKVIGSRSKPIDLKKISRTCSINYDGLSKTKVKAYDLNKKIKSEKEIRIEVEKEIKENIAKKLLYFTDIDIVTIQRIVELPQSTLKKYK